MWLMVWLACVAASSVTIDKNWRLVSSANIHASGKDISEPTYDASSWYPIHTFPATVMAVLLENGVYKDPFFGNNLQQIPTDQFNVSWWYRTSFTGDANATSLLTFKGINYRANVWMNGVLVASSANVAGTFRYFDFDITKILVRGENVLAVEVFRPWNRVFPLSNKDTDLGMTFVDWAPEPPDVNMGLWRDVVLTTLPNGVSIRYPQVTTKLSSLELAHLSVLAEVTNWGESAFQGSLQGEIPGIGSFSQDIHVGAGETKQFEFSNKTFSVLNVHSPALWWPWQMGKQTMHTLTLSAAGVVTSSAFGMREMSDEVDANTHRVYSVNGQKILIRGGGWSPDLFQRHDKARLRTDFEYTRHMNLNAIRLEGKMEPDAFFDLADETGILVLPGWCCCDSWQRWSLWKEEQRTVAAASLRDQVKRQRIHPSVLMWMYSSDELPPPDVETLYLDVYKEERWPNPLLASASDRTSKLTGPTGVKMSGPYAWVPPNYWPNNKLGGAFGFLTEGSPGAAPFPLESLEATIPRKDLWPGPNDAWNYHTCSAHGIFHDYRYFASGMDGRFGKATSAADWSATAQVEAYETHRAMFEAYSRSKYTSTGLIQWMLNNAWPSGYWHLYDYYFNPGGTFFAARKACEALHVQYSYDDRSVVVVNSLYEVSASATVNAAVISLEGTTVWQHSVRMDPVPADGVVPQFTVPESAFGDNLVFLSLNLTSDDGEEISRNMYWLRKTMDTLDYANSTFYITPVVKFVDFRPLKSLPAVTLGTNVTSADGSGRAAVTLHNPSSAVAFFTRVRLLDSAGADILPVLWDDNYISLLPGESVQVNAFFSMKVSVATVQAEPFNNVER